MSPRLSAFLISERLIALSPNFHMLRCGEPLTFIVAPSNTFNRFHHTFPSVASLSVISCRLPFLAAGTFLRLSMISAHTGAACDMPRTFLIRGETV